MCEAFPLLSKLQLIYFLKYNVHQCLSFLCHLLVKECAALSLAHSKPYGVGNGMFSCPVLIVLMDKFHVWFLY